VTDAAQDLQSIAARRIFIWQMAFFAALLMASALDNAFTVVDDYARGTDPIPLFKPMVWELSSHLLTWLLIPLMGWLLSRFPITRDSWWRSLPAHLLATLPFSLLHVEGMILLRQFAYWTTGDSYDFGPFWDNWPYEFRKDLVTYWWLLAGLLAFRIYSLWLNPRIRDADLPSFPEKPPLERLVVRTLNREFILDADEIDRIEADGNYVVVYASGQSYRLRDSLRSLSRRLDEQRFAQVHRAHVVNIDRIREIQPWDNGDYRILLSDGSFLNFSRRYRSRLNHLFE
jgi:hypothetical protein